MEITMVRRATRGRNPSEPGERSLNGGFVGGRGHGRGRGRTSRSGRANVAESDTDTDQTDQVSSDAEFRSVGLSLVGFTTSRQQVRDELNEDRFRAFYGVGTMALHALFNEIKQRHEQEKIGEKDFLMCMNWLKLYDTEHVLAGRWELHEETVRNKVKKYAKLIANLSSDKIKFEGFDNREIFIASVDGTHCPIFEIRQDPSTKWFSHKFNGPGLSYELAVAIKTSRLLSIRGPFPASTHDITIFRGGSKSDKNSWDPEALIFKIPEGKRLIGDSGYQGEPSKMAVTREDDSVEVKKFKARVKARHETFNSRLKGFRILSLPFRHGLDVKNEETALEPHKIVFHAVCVAVQYDMDNGNPLFEI
jgi:hypothetical protein